MQHRSHDHLNRTRSLGAVLALALLASGCSSEGPAPSPAKAGPAAPTPPAGEAKAKKLRPGQQNPGTSDYEDKPGARTRGR